MGKWDDLAPWESQVLAALVVSDVQRAMEALVWGTNTRLWGTVPICSAARHKKRSRRSHRTYFLRRIMPSLASSSRRRSGPGCLPSPTTGV